MAIITNAAERIDFILQHGDKFFYSFVVEVCESDEQYLLTPTDAKMDLRRCKESKAILTTNEGITISEGVLSIEIDTTPLLCATYDYALILDFEGSKKTFFKGKITITK